MSNSGGGGGGGQLPPPPLPPLLLHHCHYTNLKRSEEGSHIFIIALQICFQGLCSHTDIKTLNSPVSYLRVQPGQVQREDPPVDAYVVQCKAGKVNGFGYKW